MLRKELAKMLDKILRYFFSRKSRQANYVAAVGSSTTDEFFLDDSCEFSVDGSHSGKSNHRRWMRVTHCVDDRTSLILIANEQFQSKKFIKIGHNARLFLRFTAALPEISKDGLTLDVALKTHGDFSAHIATLPMAGGKQSPRWRELETDLSFLQGLEGWLVLSVSPGPAKDSTADWVAISDLCIARSDRLPIVKALSFHEMRTNNEIQHFSTVYQHSMYSSNKPKVHSSASPRKLEQSSAPESLERPPFILNDVLPITGESTNGYASRLLASCMDQNQPDFLQRLTARASAQKKVKVLSLCSGAARIEASYAAHFGTNVHWSLLDISAELLRMAAESFPADACLDLIEGNVNSIGYSGEKWDIIMVVSALHHVVELERVVQFCHESLGDNGELWIIGEAVGRNGNRLWPEAQEIANNVFLTLPENYRLNHHTQKIDSEIIDKDYSVGTFEGIRSEEIESVLARWFKPEELMKRNCFLWRLTNLAYADNFDITNEHDRRLLIDMVNAEVDHFESGGRGTELFAVYRPLSFTSRTRNPDQS